MKPGDLVHSYRILEKIGQGGFGEVFAAEQIEPIRRKVALKALAMDPTRREVIARFESEQQALALMNHRNIAKIHEAATSEQGQPYFVMDLIQGGTLIEMADRERLDVEARLRLFQQICEGIDHAHQKGILHRDLKPGNLLVQMEGDAPVVKIIDFGIAKALSQPLTDRTQPSLIGRAIGTPDYMSPEQVRADSDIDNRTDIYSLGVVLYELLIGSLPLELPENDYKPIVEQQEPQLPSSRLATRLRSDTAESTDLAVKRGGVSAPILVKRIRGDIDNIVMKCLEKKREKRYSYAKEISEDIQRHLDRQPVLARPQTPGYRTAKFLARHRVGVATAAAVTLIVVVAAAFALVSAFDRARSRVILDRNEAAALVAQSRLSALFDTDLALDQLRRAVELAPDFAPARVRYCLTLAKAGRLDEAKRIRDESEDTTTARMSTLGGEPETFVPALLAVLDHWRSEDLAEAAAELDDLGVSLDRRNLALAMATSSDIAAIALLDEAVDANPWNFEVRWNRANRHRSAENGQAMLDDARTLAARDIQSPYGQVLLGIALQLAKLNTDAEASFTKALDLLAESPEEVRSAIDWKIPYNRGLARYGLKEYTAAIEHLEDAATITNREHPAPLYQLSRCMRRLGRTEEQMALLEEAAQCCNDCLEPCGTVMQRLELLDRLEECARENDDPLGIARANDHRVNALILEGSPEALTQAESAVLYIEKSCAEPEARLEWSKRQHQEREAWAKMLEQRAANESSDSTQRAAEHAREAATRAARELREKERELRTYYGRVLMCRYGRGLAYWYFDQHDEAIEELRHTLEQGQHDDSLLIWQIRKLRGDEEADEDLLTYTRFARRNQKKDPDGFRIAKLLAQDADTLAEVRKVVQDGSDEGADADERRGRLQYYLGVYELLFGDRKAAKEWFRKSSVDPPQLPNFQFAKLNS